jgi:TonB-dependent SusC/RagA subfamily outer membrane receptor
MRTTTRFLVGCAALVAVARGADAQGSIAGTVRDSATSAPHSRVTVTAVGTRLTGSVSSVSSNDIATIAVPRIDQAIAGLATGVQVQTTNAQPGSDLRIRVRGGNSLRGDNEPLVVVDGVIGPDLNQISPSDIASIDVLKDASATAIWGARGANGVILVTTKRGQPGQVRFAYSGYTGLPMTAGPPAAPRMRCSRMCT